MMIDFFDKVVLVGILILVMLGVLWLIIDFIDNAEIQQNKATTIVGTSCNGYINLDTNENFKCCYKDNNKFVLECSYN